MSDYPSKGLGERAVPDDVMDVTPVGELVDRYAGILHDHLDPETPATPDERPVSVDDWLRSRWEGRIPTEFHAADLCDLPPEVGAEIERWQALREPEAANLVLTGPVGTGKTYAAAAAVRAVHWQQVDVQFWPWVELRAAMQPEGIGGEVGRSALHAGVLVLDDLGTRDDSTWALDQLYGLLNRRRAERRPVVATSNLDPREGASLCQTLGERSWSRLVGGAVVVGLGGGDRRRSR